jgi:uncharacterized protein
MENGEEGLNYLCEGYKSFFEHTEEPIKLMVDELRQGQAPSNVMS